MVTSESPSLNDLGLGGKLSVTEATRLIAAPVSSLSSSESSKDHKVDLVAFVGGDGTVFEGLQGLMDSCLANTSGQAPSASKLPHHHRPLPFVHVPGGSGNGLAASCGLWDVETAAVAIVKGVMGKLDIASVLQPSAASDPSEQGLGGKRFYSFLSTVFGLLSNIDIGTEHLRWMGEARYTHKVIQEAMALRPYPCRVAYLPASHGLNPSLSSESSQGHQVPGFPSGLPLPCLSQHKLLSSASKIDPLALPPNWRVLPRTDFNFLALYNAPFMATHARLNPRGSLSNGTMDLLWAEGLQGFMGRMQFLNMMLQSEEGGHVDLGFFNSEKVKAFAIEPLCEDTWLVVDGEVVERRTTWIEVHSSACDVIILPMDR